MYDLSDKNDLFREIIDRKQSKKIWSDKNRKVTEIWDPCPERLDDILLNYD